MDWPSSTRNEPSLGRGQPSEFSNFCTAFPKCPLSPWCKSSSQKKTLLMGWSGKHNFPIVYCMDFALKIISSWFACTIKDSYIFDKLNWSIFNNLKCPWMVVTMKFSLHPCELKCLIHSGVVFKLYKRILIYLIFLHFLRLLGIHLLL